MTKREWKYWFGIRRYLKTMMRLLSEPRIVRIPARTEPETKE